MSEVQGRALLQVGLDLLLVDLALDLVREQDHDHVGALTGVGDLGHLHAVLLGVVPGLSALAQAHDHVEAGVAQAHGLGLALGAETDDRDLLALQHAQVGV